MDQDTDVVDLPRFRSARDAALDMGLEGTPHKAYCVYTKHTVNNGRSNPHFLFLTDRHPDQDCYTSFICSCGNAVRCGVPCRHFWAVYTTRQEAGFHLGMVNDLWFRSAQPVREHVHVFAFQGTSVPPIDHCRPLCRILQPNEPSDDSELCIGDAEGVRTIYSRMRLFGNLLGVAKKAIEAVVESGNDVQSAALSSYLAAIAAGGGTDLPRAEQQGSLPAAVRPPPSHRGKGRPSGSLNRVRPATLTTTTRDSTGRLAAASDCPTASLQPNEYREPLAGMDANVVMSQAGESAPPYAEDQAIACSQSIAGKPPAVPRKRPTCKACGEVGHRSTNRQCIRHREHRGQPASQENRQETSAGTC
jgi:hypothetical protein